MKNNYRIITPDGERQYDWTNLKEVKLYAHYLLTTTNYNSLLIRLKIGNNHPLAAPCYMKVTRGNRSIKYSEWSINK